jgi:TrmH family RNA methyltransferase
MNICTFIGALLLCTALNVHGIFEAKGMRYLTNRLNVRARWLSMNANLNFPLISSESNEKIKYCKSLFIKKNKRSEVLLLETHRVVVDALKLGYIPELLLVSENGLDKSPMGSELKEYLRLPKFYSSVSQTSQAILDKISMVEQNQGIIGVFRRKEKEIPPNPSFLICCDKIADPGNMGTIIRTSYGLGAEALLSVEGVDPWSPKCIRAASSAALHLPVISSTWNQISTLTSSHNMQVYLATLDSDAVPYYNVNYNIPCMVVIGSEATGIGINAKSLPNAKSIYIPMENSLESLNAAVAASIILAEVSKQRKLGYNLPKL